MDAFVFWKVTVADLISIVTLGVTIWIAIKVQSSLTKSRYIREYFIKDAVRYKEDYLTFINILYTDGASAKEIKDWLKFMSLTVTSFEHFITGCYDIPKGKLLNLHAEFQQFITAEDDFNNQYKNDKVIFSAEVKTKLLKHQKDISNAFMQMVIEINSAKEYNKKKIRSFMESFRGNQ